MGVRRACRSARHLLGLPRHALTEPTTARAVRATFAAAAASSSATVA